ncbi:DUF3516 domain-containing protein [Corynebacterium sp. sy017]|uniref:DEAD/DEAH box helicase n=1 Tax=unclassified Corynebacterium TaxID=2624378 RepID=UPI001185F181|nr:MULTISPECIES: DEAD/DEAH box helicase [unclassified Corynebacterium]MBP3087767.1 DUF3516 domain-containing protein [Corynebacterium sp. sy017]QDZ42741.1 DUF3516 domain-containing protein [Corynebacterium sp. sy039]TSD92316.1 DUF3516 domain-containing protein [Corynebacterium sp. SY003]
MNLSSMLPDLAEVPESFVDESIFDSFLGWVRTRNIQLYPAQEEAALSILTGDNVILATPTGSGKSMVAIAAHFIALARGQRSFYTAPIKALVSEKFFALCEIFGPESVGMMTGDASVNSQAPIICATAEIVANMALREGANAHIDQVIMDEFHYYSDPQRGWSWQVPLLELPHAQFLLMSATLGDTTQLSADLSKRTNRKTTLVGAHSQRPVPLEFDFVYTPVHETIETLLKNDKAPIYVVHFTQREAIERAQALSSITIIDQETKERIAQHIGNFRFSTTFGHTLSKLLRRGIGVHHAGMLPKYRRLVEKLSQTGLLKVICGTDTLGVGINVPIRTVLLCSLAKFDGNKQRIISSREFHQIAGRAGRAGFDSTGYVVIQATEHEIENWRARQRAGSDPKKIKKIRKKSTREGEVGWTENTYKRLIDAPAEPLQSQFKVSNSMLLNVIARGGDTYAHMQHLLRTNHNSRRQQNQDILTAIELVRGLVNAGIVVAGNGRYQLTQELQYDFALNQPLSPFALAALELLDKQSPSYELDVISVFEAILEDPRIVLIAQQKEAKSAELAALNADGASYSEKMKAIDEITWPQPLGDLLSNAYHSYTQGHPWAKEFDIHPKSVVREMLEKGWTFSDLISAYGLARAEGVVLRYLIDAWRTLEHTLPQEYKTEELENIIEWLGESIKHIDSSLVNEWLELTDPEQPISRDMLEKEVAFGVDNPDAFTANKRAFEIAVRNFFFQLVVLLAYEKESQLAEKLDYLEQQPDWVAGLDAYFDEYDDIDTSAQARGREYFSIKKDESSWEVTQILKDPDNDNAYRLVGVVDLPASDAAEEIRLSSIEFVY